MLRVLRRSGCFFCFLYQLLWNGRLVFSCLCFLLVFLVFVLSSSDWALVRIYILCWGLSLPFRIIRPSGVLAITTTPVTHYDIMTSERTCANTTNTNFLRRTDFCHTTQPNPGTAHTILPTENPPKPLPIPYQNVELGHQRRTAVVRILPPLLVVRFGPRSPGKLICIQASYRCRNRRTYIRPPSAPVGCRSGR